MIFSTPGDSKLTPDSLRLQKNRQKFFSSVELVGRNRAPVHFKTEGVARPFYAHRDFDQRLLDFPELGKYIPLPGTLN